jgi:hypothetical protein
MGEWRRLCRQGRSWSCLIAATHLREALKYSRNSMQMLSLHLHEALKSLRYSVEYVLITSARSFEVLENSNVRR